jgi:hypothetical protein
LIIRGYAAVDEQVYDFFDEVAPTLIVGSHPPSQLFDRGRQALSILFGSQAMLFEISAITSQSVG